ncbi:hypothetical protein N181_24515 [Sinorhizobium fredii USDA 205]|nr:hypothetical protein AB395_00006610 [Sinorhizobium fredii CCBAU 45436]KSV83939.1 hypothetical protein N181_24515 [Sinorhizobium fredii USDA 205]OAP35659.1 hypothetical protein AU381_12175 [Sinorhizobium glycinis]
MGAVIDGSEPTVVRNRETIRVAGIAGAEFDDICDICKRERVEIERRRHRYLAARAPVNVAGRIGGKRWKPTPWNWIRRRSR